MATKTGWWGVKFDITLEGEEVRFEDLDESTQEHIAECIKDGYYGGEIVMEEEEHGRRYYEVEFGHHNIEYKIDTYSICIIAEHYPTLEEVAEFCKEDMRKLGYECVLGISDLSYEEAHKFFDMDNEDELPVLK